MLESRGLPLPSAERIDPPIFSFYSVISFSLLCVSFSRTVYQDLIQVGLVGLKICIVMCHTMHQKRCHVIYLKDSSLRSKQRFLSWITYLSFKGTGCLRKNALLGFLNPWDRLMPVVTIVLVKVVGGMLDDD